MGLIKRMRNDLILAGVFVVAGYVAYNFLLDERAREGVATLNRTIRESYNNLSSMINEHIGTIMDEEVVTQNRADIREAWEELGY